MWELVPAGRAGLRIGSGTMPEWLEASQTAALGLVGIHRVVFKVPPTRMGRMVGTARHRPTIPAVIDVEGQRHIGGDRGMQAGRRLPRPEPNATHVFPFYLGMHQRYALTIASDAISFGIER